MDRAVARQLVADLLNMIPHGTRKASVARDAGLNRSDLTNWEKGTLPRTFNAQLVGGVLGRRLEWEPSDPRWPGAELPYRDLPPAELAMAGTRPGPGRKKADNSSPVLLDAYLLGAEAMWARIYVKRWSLAECPADRQAWGGFERGPREQAPTGSGARHRQFQSSPLPTAVLIGRRLGLDLVWRQRGDLYRVRPWEVQTPPPPATSRAALAQELRLRPTLW